MRDKQAAAGIWFAIGAMVVGGMLPVASNYAVRSIPPLLFGGLITFLSSIPFFIRLAFSGDLGRIFDKEFQKPIFGITFFATLAGICFFLGTKFTSGINTGLLTQIEPVYSVVLAALFLGESIGAGQLIWTAVLILGAGAVAYNGPVPLNKGDALILLTPLFYQLSHVVSKKIIARLPRVEMIPAVRLFYSGLAITIIALILDPASLLALGSREWAFIVFAAVFFRYLDLTLWYGTLARLPLAKASGFLPLSLATSFVGSVWFLGEVPAVRQYVGLLLILAGVAGLSSSAWKNARKEPIMTS